MKRKWILPAAVLLTALCLACCAAEELTGVWVFTEVGTGGVEASAEYTGLDISLTLYENGQAVRLSGDREAWYTWTVEEDGLHLSDGSLWIIGEDGRLSFTEKDSLTMYFTRDSAERPHSQRTWAARDAVGHWRVTGCSVGGLSFEPETLGLQAETLTLFEDGSGLRTSYGVTKAGYWSLEDGGLLRFADMELHFAEDGSLTIERTGGMTVWFTKEE